MGMNAPYRKLILGIDEAGYGPNLGPLVIACSAWIIDEHPMNGLATAETMLDRLSPLFLPKPIRSAIKHIPLGDSKAIYTSGKSIAGLSLGVRYWLQQCKIESRTFQEILDIIAPTFTSSSRHLPWYLGPEGRLSRTESFCPLDESVPDSLQVSATDAYQAVGLQFLGLSAIAIDERQFNRDVEYCGNKASLLSHASLQLAVDCLHQHASRHPQSIDSIHIYCDKHGGRNRYQALLMDAMPEVWFNIDNESAVRSDYRASWQDRELRWSFLAKGDRLFASALASMTAKWLREGLMQRLNNFWQSQVANLPPTAGYPVDAKRFRAAIEPIAEQLHLPIADWWRFR